MSEQWTDELRQEAARRLDAIRQDPDQLMRYDLNGDGKIDDDEWDQVRRMVEGEVLTAARRRGKSSLLAPAAAALEIVAGRYEISRELGRGGMACTYLARDRDTGHEVAVKQLALERVDDWKAVELFEREGKILEQLDHPSIPRYVDAFYEEGDGERKPRFYLVQEHVEGQTLEAEIESGRRVREAEAVRLLRQVLEVLEYLHGLNPPVIHRDLKPSNLIHRPDGRVAVIDFGAIQEALTTATTVGSTFVGTCGYMAPEQFMGRAVPATDIYALGATFVHLLSHSHPADLPVSRMRLEFRSVVNVSEPLKALLERMLEPAVEDRFSGAGEVTKALVQLGRKPPKASPPEAAAAPPASVPARRRSYALSITIAVLLVLGAVLALVMKTSNRPAPRSRTSYRAPATRSHAGRVVPLELKLAPKVLKLSFEVHGARLLGFGKHKYLKANFDLINRSRTEIRELQVQAHLMDAGGKLVGGQTKKLIRPRTVPELRPGERRGYSLTLYRQPATVRRARITVTMATGVAAPPSYPPLAPLPVIWDVPRPDGISFATRRLLTRTFSNGAVTHVLHIQVENAGSRPVTLLKVQKRMYDGSGALVKTTDKYVTTSSGAPLRPGQSRASVVYTYSKTPFTTWKLAATDLR